MDKYPQKIIIHPKYDDDTLEFDIALVKIKAVEFSSHIKPIDLPSTKLASGWKRRKRGKMQGKETNKRLEREQRIAKEGKRKKRKIERKKLNKWKRSSESRIYQPEKRMKKRLVFLKQKRNLMKQKLNKIARQSGVKPSGKIRKRRTKNELNTILKKIDILRKKIMELIEEEYEGCNIKEEQRKTKKITWYLYL